MMLAVVLLAAAACTPRQPVPAGEQREESNQNEQEEGGQTNGGSFGATVEFRSVSRFDIGGLGESGTAAAACLVTNSATELEQRISQGLPQMLRSASIDFSTQTLISAYAAGGTSMEVTGVTQTESELVVRYRTVTDPQRLLLTVIYAPNEHLTVAKTRLPVRCVAS